jgi:hypothetical protein
VRKTILMASLAAAFSLVTPAPAHAAIVVSGNGFISSGSASQNGHVTQDGTPSTWAAPKTYPGEDGVPTNYDLIDATFGANALQPIYYEISYLAVAGSGLFSVAYLDSFVSVAPGVNYLGDSGLPNTTYQVVVPTGGHLLVNFQSDGALDYSYLVQAFSDANRGESFLTGAVPEPSTWAMMLMGFGAVGFTMRRRRRIAQKLVRAA